MQTQNDFKNLERELLPIRTTMLENEILCHWRSNEPKKLDELFLRGMVSRSLKMRARDLLSVQRTMEETEQLPPSLARMEAWRQLMRIEEDETEEAAAWGMTLDEYRNRQWAAY